MSIEIKSRQDLTLDLYRKVAWNGETIRIHPDTVKAIDEARKEFEQFMADHPDLTVYGYNIHVGDGAGKRLSEEDSEEYLHGLGSGVSFGEALPQRTVRGIVLSRLPGILGGNSAVRGVFAEHIASMLERPELPKVPMISGGSGEINPLGMLFGNVPNELRLVAKEPMVLINGHPCASSMVCDTYLRSVGTIKLVEEICALVADAFEAPMTHYAYQLELVWEDPDEQAGLRKMRELLDGYTTPRRTKQALVSVRDIPLMLGTLYKTQRQLKEVAANLLKSVSDNPIFMPAAPGVESEVMSNASYHNQSAIVVIDQLNRCYADMCAVCQAFIHGFYLDRKSIPEMDNACMGVLMMPASAWMDEARMYAVPSILSGPQPGQNDVPSTTFQAYHHNLEVERCLMGSLTIAAAMAAQAFAQTKRVPAKALVPVLARIQSVFPEVTQRRNIGDKLEKLFALFQEASFAYAAADEKPDMVLGE